jgi:hypothetical protein
MKPGSSTVFSLLARLPRGVRVGGAVVSLVLCAGALGGFAYWKNHGAALVPGRGDAPAFDLVLRPDRETYAHDAMVEFLLEPASPKVTAALRASTAPFHGWVERDGRPVETVGVLSRVRLRYDATAGLWRARWPVPWNAPDGDYDLRLDTAALPAGLGALRQGGFRLASRPFEAVPAGMAVLTLEGQGSLARFAGPDGGAPRISALAEWADYIGADTVLIQGAESSGFTAKLPSDFPWHSRPRGPVVELAKECRRRGVRLGVYILSYMVGGPPEFSPDYQYGVHYQKGQAIAGLDLPKRRGVSIREDKRPGDIVKILDHWAAVEGVDFLGLDYIRPVFGSQEMVDDFIREMPGVEKPEGYDAWTPQQRMVWIGRGRMLAPRADQRTEPRYRTSDQWFWYRAHRTAAVVRRIAEGFAGKKPLWAFTLSWQKGWEHGQDPAMMRDAGIDMNGIMLYEADEAQYRGLVRQWNAYTRDAPFNLVVGNTFDWRLHQKTVDPAGPEAMVQRLMAAVERFQDKRPVRGVFLHDLPRALRGSIGPYPPKEWMLAGGSAITRTREIHNVLPYRVEWNCPDALKPGTKSTATVTLSRGAGPVRAEIYTSADVTASVEGVVLSSATPSVAVELLWKPTERSAVRGDRVFAAVRTTRPAVGGDRAQIHAAYIPGVRAAAPAPKTVPPAADAE